MRTCIIIAGPTAVGKTSLSIELAKHYNTEIISADSRQCFRELNIGVAKPSAAQLAAVKHHFINSHSIHDNVNAAVFENYALAAADAIFQHADIALMVGGTGLYIKAFVEGLDDIPTVPLSVRDDIITSYKTHGLKWLQDEVRKHDPAYYEHGETQNPQRLMRALEVRRATGQSIVNFQQKQKIPRAFRIIQIGLELPRPSLYENINGRVDDMIKQGLMEEARSLLPYQHINALQTVGYKELFGFFDGMYDAGKAVELIKTNTRNYAKRQMTWFKKDPQYTWFHPGESSDIIQFIDGTRKNTK